MDKADIYNKGLNLAYIITLFYLEVIKECNWLYLQYCTSKNIFLVIWVKFMDNNVTAVIQ